VRFLGDGEVCSDYLTILTDVQLAPTVAATTSATMTMIIAPVHLDDRIMNPTKLDPASRPP
jgi:hypothetical protein